MHDHHHDHDHGAPASPEETLALLTYMLGHNRHHAQELGDLAAVVENESARALLSEAVDALSLSNDRLAAALDLLKEG